MDTRHNQLEEVLDCLYHEQTANIPILLPGAREDFRSLAKDLSLGDRRRLNFIPSLLNYCEDERWFLARSQLEPAEQEYHRYFVDKVVATPKAGHYEFHSRQLNSYPDIALAKRGASGKGTDKAASKAGSAGSETRRNVNVNEGITSVENASTPSQIADKFTELYNKEWKAAIYELEQLKIYEARAIGCLLSVVMDAYRVCKIEADNQMAKLESAAFNIVTEGAYMDREVPVQRDRRCLLEFRRGIAHLCVDRLQESFRRRYLPEIIRSVGVYQHVRTHGPVNKFANQCVALCWRMVILDPPIHVLDDRFNPGLFNAEIYKEYSRAGKAVAYHVWPALLAHKDGPILAKGVAQGNVWKHDARYLTHVTTEMCDVIDGKLELLFAHLSLNNVPHIKPLLVDAIDEYQAISRTLSYEERRKLHFIKHLLWHAERGEWTQARDKLNGAQRAYQEYIGAKINVMKKPIGYSHIHGKQSHSHSNPTDTKLQQYMFRNDEFPTPSTYRKEQMPRALAEALRPRSTTSVRDVYSKTTSSSRSVPGLDTDDQGPTETHKRDSFRHAGYSQYINEPGNESRQQEQMLHSSSATYIEEDKAKVKDTDFHRPTKIADAHWSVYKGEWLRALEAVKLTGVSEEKAIACLFYIVQEAYQFCLLEANAQILEFERAALNILTEGMYSQDQRHRLAVSGNLKHMTRYRGEVAQVAVSRLQEVFLTKILPLIHRKYSVRARDAIDSYARRCVEVTWRMAIQEPPLSLVYQDVTSATRDAEFDVTLYEAYHSVGGGGGGKVKVYVWPALRLYENGPLLCRGVAKGNY